MRSIANGDRKAFGQLYQLFSDKVYNVALGYTHNEQDAEEVAQDVFVKVFRNAAQFKGEAKVSTWIYRITVNVALNLLKKRKRYAFLSFGKPVQEEIDFEHPGILLERQEDAKILFKAIKKLPEQQQTAFILSFVEGLPRQQVADIMSTSLKAVEALLQRGKRNLRKSLGDLYIKRRKKA
ncbi:MAG: sigma-70 family RNA polymerase sigma factor [Saprospiraceae bacterium]|nr:sigma-70 family RNA polymerase sigma factor [Saprospiraceae bacterium]